MANRKLANLDLDDAIKAKLAYRGLQTNKDIAVKSNVELMELLDIDLNQAVELLSNIANQVIQQPKTALQLLDETPTEYISLSSAYPSLCLLPGLTELVGPAGLGKTQTCLTLLTIASLNGGSVIYIDTESTFSAARLYEVATHRYPEQYPNKAAVEELLARVHVIHAPTSEQLLLELQSIEEKIIEHSVKLIILDGIASPVRQEFDRNRLGDRQEFLAKVASILKFVSEQFQLPCLATNQVTTKYGGSSGSTSFQAALGVAWAHAVNTRWIVEEGDMPGSRRIRIGKSPMFRASAFEYVVTEAGVIVKGKIEGVEDQLDVIHTEIRKSANADGHSHDMLGAETEMFPSPPHSDDEMDVDYV